MKSDEHRRTLTEKQFARRAAMQAKTFARLDEIATSARASAFTVGVRTTQPVEVRALQRRLRAVTQRWCPIWTTDHAAVASPGMPVALDHVVPVVVLVERVLQGDDVRAVIEQSVLCRLTYEEHRVGGLEVAFRLKQQDLYHQMLACPIEQLGALGWQRYVRAGISVSPLEGWRTVNFG